MATPTRVGFSPKVPASSTAQAPKIAHNPNVGLNADDILPERPTILRIKRRREELIVDTLVLEAQVPSRKKKTMKELTDALQSLKVAQELHEQFQEHMRQKQASLSIQSKDSDTDNATSSVAPTFTWAVPSKTLENKMRRVFKLIGSDDSSRAEGRHISSVINDAQSGRLHKHDILNLIAKRSYESSKRERAYEALQRNAELRHYHLRRVDQTVEKVPGEVRPQDPDEICRLLELVTEEEANKITPSSTDQRIAKKGSKNELQLPVVHSARKLKEMQTEQSQMPLEDDEQFVNAFYVLDDDAVVADVQEFQSVQVPLSQFRQELMDEYVMEEYSDSDEREDSSDSQNRKQDWEYGSDRDDDGRSFSSSDYLEDSSAEGMDEIMEDDGDYDHRMSRHHRGYDLELDPTERMDAGSEDEDDVP